MALSSTRHSKNSADSSAKRAKLVRMRSLALGLGLLGILASAFGLWRHPESFFPAYLVAFMLCLGLSLGPLGLWLLHNLVGGAWGEGMKWIMRTAARIVLIMPILFLPLALGLEKLYPWAQEDKLAADEHLAHKVWYLNEAGFLLRAILFFAGWILFAVLLQRGSSERAQTYKKGRQAWSGLGLIIFIISITFAAIDWLMSLSPLFYSTIYGFIVIAGQVASTFALTIILAAFLPSLVLSQDRPMAKLSHDFGNFLLMSVMLWAYVSFSQLILIWSGQLPEEIMFYNFRFAGGWEWVGWALLVLHFFLPFFLLLSRQLKRNVHRLVWVAILLLFARWLDMYWLVQPNFSPNELALPVLMITLPLTLASLWFGLFLFLIERLRYA